MAPRLSTGLWVAQPSDDPNYRSVPDEVRVELMLSMAAVARQAGVDRSAVSMILGRGIQNGKVRACRLETAAKITRALGKERVEDLFEPAVPGSRTASAQAEQYALLLNTLASIPGALNGPAGELVRLLGKMSPQEVFWGQTRFLATSEEVQ